MQICVIFRLRMQNLCAIHKDIDIVDHSKSHIIRPMFGGIIRMHRLCNIQAQSGCGNRLIEGKMADIFHIPCNVLQGLPLPVLLYLNFKIICIILGFVRITGTKMKNLKFIKGKTLLGCHSNRLWLILTCRKLVIGTPVRIGVTVKCA